MIDFEKMRTEETTYVRIVCSYYADLKLALELSGEQGWKFQRGEELPEEIRKKYSEENLEDEIFLVSNFDADALSAVLPNIRYDMDIQAAKEEQDYRSMRWELDTYGKEEDEDGKICTGGTCADFYSGKMEEEQAEMLLSENAEAITEWLNNENNRSEICFSRRYEDFSLECVARHGDSVLCKYGTIDSVIKLKKDATVDKGFRICDMFWYLEDYIKEFSAQDENAPVREYNRAPTLEELQEMEEEEKRFLVQIREEAEQGDAEAQYHLGWSYMYGSGVEQSYEKAVEWYRKAAEQGHELAQIRLGDMYADGQGAEQSYEKAVEWYEKAAEQGYVDMQMKLGDMYVAGQGVEQSYEKAAEWYRKAAEQGDGEEQKHLGDIYAAGQGVEQSYEKAAEWYRKAAEYGYKDAQKKMGDMYAVGQGVEQSYEKAAEWYRKAAEQGDKEAQKNMEEMYRIDIEESYRKATEQGDAEAQKHLGHMYDDGKGVEQNYEKAAEWYRKAAEQGDTEAQWRLGWMYEDGKGVERSYKKAAEWYQKAAEQGYVRGKVGLRQLMYKISLEQND